MDNYQNGQNERNRRSQRNNEYQGLEKKSNNWIKVVAIILIIIIIILVLATYIYKNQISAIDKENAKEIHFKIENGSSVNEVANVLKKEGLIKNINAFKLYYKLNNRKELKSGEYKIGTDKDVNQIITTLENGDVYIDRKILTIKEGKNIRQIAKSISEMSDNTEEEIFAKMKDEKYLDKLIDKYWFLTDKIKDKKIYYPLEGYLYPETYFFSSKDLSLETIFGLMLDQTEKELQPYKSKYIDESGNMRKNTFLPIEQLVTLASIVELEASSLQDRKDVAGIFLNRLTSDMSMGSDVTTYYAIKINLWERDLTMKELNDENPYNTRGPNMQGKLPIGPICSPSIDSIKAVLEYTKSDDYYFVSDKNGKIYTTKNLTEHNKLIDKLKAEGLWHVY